jgi:UDP-glucuronate decarboxylase
MENTINRIYLGLSETEKNLFNSKTILITGYRGFIGSVLSSFFEKFFIDLNLSRLILLDNSKVEQNSNKTILLSSYNQKIFRLSFNVINGNYIEIPHINEVDYVFHLASIASPTYYRKYPLETMDANVLGIRRLLDFYIGNTKIKFLQFSSSEIYGDPFKDFIPTSEEFNGNVSTVGPRSCYDESKRYSETICYYYYELYSMDISIVRPFNNYGPGMRLTDKRAPADFARSIINNEDIVLLSNGSPTRSYLFVSDAIIGYIKAIQYNGFEIFNIGNDSEEMSISDFAMIFVNIGKKLFDYEKEIKFGSSIDQDYLINNPQRRMPNIIKARKKLNFNPITNLVDGITEYLYWAKENQNL